MTRVINPMRYSRARREGSRAVRIGAALDTFTSTVANRSIGAGTNYRPRSVSSDRWTQWLNTWFTCWVGASSRRTAHLQSSVTNAWCALSIVGTLNALRARANRRVGVCRAPTIRARCARSLISAVRSWRIAMRIHEARHACLVRLQNGWWEADLRWVSDEHEIPIFI